MVALLVMLLRAGSYIALLEESFTVLVLTTVVLPVTFLLLTYFGGGRCTHHKAVVRQGMREHCHPLLEVAHAPDDSCHCRKLGRARGGVG